MACPNTLLWDFCTKNVPVYINEDEVNLGSDKSIPPSHKKLIYWHPILVQQRRKNDRL